MDSNISSIVKFSQFEDIPDDIFLNHIFFYLTKQELSVLRLICIKLWKMVGRIWKQWVPLDLLQNLFQTYEQLGWNKPRIYGIYATKPIRHNTILSPKFLSLARKDELEQIRHWDFGKMMGTLNIMLQLVNLHQAETLILNFWDNLTESDLVELITRFPHLSITFKMDSSSSFNLLYYASFHCYLQLGKLLLQNKTVQENIDLQCGPHGQTCLFVACLNRHTEMVELLVNGGAKAIIPRFSDNLSPYVLAQQTQQCDILKIFKVPTIN